MNAIRRLHRTLIAALAILAITTLPAVAQEDEDTSWMAPTTTSLDTDYSTDHSGFTYDSNFASDYYDASTGNTYSLDTSYDYYSDFYGNMYQVEPLNCDFYSNGDLYQVQDVGWLY
ncbi:hypothetical protein JXA47_05770 [Candidatus Sumerlaeota bacterium]|nr:hypothetical protein [Candidatus Sumerlaeota bacterium]